MDTNTDTPAPAKVYYDDCTDCFAQPGQHNIIDLVHPHTGLSLHSRETLEQISLRYPGAVKMNFDEYKQARAAEQDGPVTWAEVSEEVYDDALNVLPPAYMGGGGFLLGEPYDHHATTGQPRFHAYYGRGGKFYSGSRPMRVSEFREFIGSVPRS